MPSFAIEAPAEANPFNEQALYRVLISATSGDPHQLQTGTKQLQNWEKTAGFYSALQSIYIDLSLPVEIRHLAIIHLKNAVEKRWKKGPNYSISVEEKSFIKSRCVDSVLNEPIEKLAVLSAIFTAKVLRAENSKDWIAAVESLTARLLSTWERTPASPHLARLLLLLLYVTKEAASGRLQTFRTSLKSQARRLTESIFTVYEGLASKWLTFLRFGGDDEGGALDSMETSLLALRTLRRILILGFDNPNRDSVACEVWPRLINHLDQMLTILAADSDLTLPLNDRPKYLVERHLIQISKLHLNMARDHPAAFALLPQAMELTRSYWGYAYRFGDTYGKKADPKRNGNTNGNYDGQNDIPFAEQLSLKALLLLRACSKMVHNPVQTFRYHDEEAKKERAEAKEVVKNQLLVTDFVRDLVKALVTEFFVFTSRDLKQWELEPEEWERSQEVTGEDWEFSIRTCAEKLFLETMINYRQDLVPILSHIIMTGEQRMSDNVWLKDSLYAAIGLAAPVLYETFDFASFLENTLVQDASRKEADYNIIRRRIAVVLGHWLPVKEGLNRPLVYEIFQHLLNPDEKPNDEVVQITAARKLGDVVDPFEFKAQEFAPFAPTIISRLLNLIHEVSLPDTRLAIMNTIHLIVIKMEDGITPFGDQILNALPPIWEASAEELLVKEMILSILSALLGSMRAESRKYHASLVPLLASSTSLSESEEPYLAEESMNLWSAILDQTPTSAPESVLSLLQNLLPMLDLETEMLDRALTILDAYIYLIPAEIIKNTALIFGRLVAVLRGHHREPIGLITHSLDLILCSAIKIGGGAVEEVVSALLSIDLLSTIFSLLHEAHEAHQTTGPNRKMAQIDGVIETDYFSVLARITLASPDIFTSAYSAAHRNLPIDWLLDEWFSHIDNISHPDHKKLSCLALTNFLSTGQPFILSRLQLLMAMWTSVVMELEVEYEDENNPGTFVTRDCLLWNAENHFATEAEQQHVVISPSLQRSRDLTMADPVHTVDTKAGIREKLGMAIQMCGGMDAFRERWVGDVDKEVLDAFQGLGIF